MHTYHIFSLAAVAFNPYALNDAFERAELPVSVLDVMYYANGYGTADFVHETQANLFFLSTQHFGGPGQPDRVKADFLNDQIRATYPDGPQRNVDWLLRTLEKPAFSATIMVEYPDRANSNHEDFDVEYTSALNVLVEGIFRQCPEGALMLISEWGALDAQNRVVAFEFSGLRVAESQPFALLDEHGEWKPFRMNPADPAHKAAFLAGQVPAGAVRLE